MTKIKLKKRISIKLHRSPFLFISLLAIIAIITMNLINIINKNNQFDYRSKALDNDESQSSGIN
jgi:hypothetical protein